MKLLKDKKEREKDDTRHVTNETILTKRCIVDVFSGHFSFEVYHTMPAFAGILCYCLAHFSIFELFALIFKELTHEFDSHMVHITAFFVGAFLSRMSGGLWLWLNDRRYSGLKMDMRNKYILGEWDAKILRWFHKCPQLRVAMQVLGSYLLFIALSYLMHNIMMPAACDIRQSIIDGLPSMKFENRTTKTKELFFNEHPSMDDDARMDLWKSNPTWDSSDDLGIDDEQYLWSQLSVNSYFAFYGEADTFLSSLPCTFQFYVIFSIVGTYFMSKLGLQLID